MHFYTHGPAALRTVSTLLTSCVALSAAEPSSSVALGDSGASLRLIDISFNLMTAAGASTASDDAIPGLYGGHHDPARRGFTLQQAEISLAGAVDPYFTAEAHLNAGEEGIELEEAFGTTTSLPGGLEIRGGYFLSEFGRVNPTHAHAWAWMSQTIVSTRFLGGEGTRGAGARVAWLTPLPWYSRVLVSAQNASNESASSFLGLVDEDNDTITVGGLPRVLDGTHNLGDLLGLLRWENAADLGSLSMQLGASVLSGPNASGTDASTLIYGVDFVAKWRPSGGRQGYPFVTCEIEVMSRDYSIENAEDLRDHGSYVQALYGFITGWAVGLRAEMASGSGETGVTDRSDDPLRDDRTRLSPLLSWNPSHFSRLRLQYDYDQFDHDADGEDSAHSVWFGFEVLIGAHPAHKF